VSSFVIDASVALAWCFDDEATEATRALLDRFEDERAEVPSLWHLELANALAGGERHKRITRARTNEFIALIGGLPIRDRRADPDPRSEHDTQAGAQ
jgi:predicted nucleic acid-binding protein